MELVAKTFNILYIIMYTVQFSIHRRNSCHNCKVIKAVNIFNCIGILEHSFVLYLNSSCINIKYKCGQSVVCIYIYILQYKVKQLFILSETSSYGIWRSDTVIITQHYILFRSSSIRFIFPLLVCDMGFYIIDNLVL